VLRIVPATEKDVPLILEFVRELAAYEKLTDAVEADERRLRQTLFGPEPKARVLLAYEADAAVAYAVYYFTYSTFVGLPGLYLEDVYVRSEFRKHGAGQALMRYLAQLALANNCRRIEWAVLHWNQNAIRFYRRLGALPMEECAVYRLQGEALRHLAGD
jgi:GNAT superfamily N-acetyltransferase